MTFDQCVASIDTEYRSLGHALGWRFLTCRKALFCPETKVLMLSTNPGGSSEDPEHPRASSEAGSSYVVERWHGFPAGSAPLQEQVQQMASKLGLRLDDLLSAYFIPFRSPEMARLHRPEESKDFAIRLWEGAFDAIAPELVICLGKETQRLLREVVGSPQKASEVGVGWGSQTAGIDRYADKVVLTLPHLSRFKLFGRFASEQALQEAFARVSALRSELSTRES
jgi:hypothetical protein